MTIRRVQLPREAVERLECDVTTDADPSAAAIEFAVTKGVNDRPSVWSAGSWATGSASQVRPGVWEAVARTPLIGTGTLDLLPGLWLLWARFTLGAETFARDVGEFEVT